MGFKARFARYKCVVEDCFLSAPSIFFRPHFRCDNMSGVQSVVKELNKTAACDLGIIVPFETCMEIKYEMDAAFSSRRPKINYQNNPVTGIQQIVNPAYLHPAVIYFATHPFLVSIVEHYLRRRIYLADIDIRRVPPISMDEIDKRAETKNIGYTSSHWHRDIRGRQVKVMIYLTDIGEKDNNFAYIPNTHAGYQCRPKKLEQSRISDNQVSIYSDQIVECYGMAGTTFVFDTNIIHRLRRKETSIVRDSMTFYYTPGQELRKIDLMPNTLSAMSKEARALFL